jgi:hypothetical protein
MIDCALGTIDPLTAHCVLLANGDHHLVSDLFRRFAHARLFAGT